MCGRVVDVVGSVTVAGRVVQGAVRRVGAMWFANLGSVRVGRTAVLVPGYEVGSSNGCSEGMLVRETGKIESVPVTVVEAGQLEAGRLFEQEQGVLVKP